MTIESVDDVKACDLYFSALDAETAARVERRLAAGGAVVVSNASAHRMAPDVPLIVPEINPGHLELLGDRPAGGVVTNPNCATAGLVMVLGPLAEAFGLEAVGVTTLQAVSGAGYPGVSALDILGNVVPGIEGEAEKIEREPRKILGRLIDGRIEELPIAISAQTTRVPVLDGHLLSLSIGLGRRASPDEIGEILERFRSPLADLGLPSAPDRPLRVLPGPADPQPRRHAGLGDGMTVSVGQIRPCPILDVRLVALVHNTVRGAAGAAVLNAELLVASEQETAGIQSSAGRS